MRDQWNTLAETAETAEIGTRRNLVKSTLGAGKQQRIQHSTRVSQFYSQEIRIFKF